jgi:vacuolar protein sorting-associated protein 13A/C
MALNSVLTAIFNKYLGPYVENLDGSQLRLSLFTGNVTLKDLAIKPDALYSLLDLPIRVVAGSIGSINVSIPLSALRSKPTVVTLDSVYLLVAPWFDGKPVASSIIAAAKSKNALLATIEQHYIAAKLHSSGAQPAIQSDEQENKLFEGLIGTIIANLQVRITRVHVRYEHPLSIVPQPRGLDSVRSVIFGLSIAELAISTCNEKWVVEFVRRPGDTVFKLGSLQGVSVYLDSLLQVSPLSQLHYV